MAMDSIWHLRGSIPIEPDIANLAVLNGVTTLLEQQRKTVTETHPDRVLFEDPMWRWFLRIQSNWAVLILFDQGELTIERGNGERRLVYDFRMLHGFVFCVFAATMLGATAAQRGGIAGGLLFGGIAFAWIYGMNILIGQVRVPGKLRSAIHPA